MSKQKSWEIPKREVLQAFKEVRKNKGSAGVDGMSIEKFGENLENNLYKLWNRMSSGSYFPKAVKEVEIPKRDGGIRKLGIPTVADRVAQMVVANRLQPKLEKIFHNDSYGYRIKKSAHDALEKARYFCSFTDWVVDLDIKGFFDNLDHELLMKVVRRHTEEKWILLYIERWLKMPAQNAIGEVVQRDKGTPQGGVISPLLANMFLHYAFDMWMSKEFPKVSFERFADDIIVHCKTEKQANYILMRIKMRMQRCKLDLHPVKTKIVYCKDDRRTHDYLNTKFDFLGHTFRMRRTKTKEGKISLKFGLMVSKTSLKKMYEKIRELDFHRQVSVDIRQIATLINPILRGWINYYGKFTKWDLGYFFYRLNLRLIKWARNKYKRLRTCKRRAYAWLQKLQEESPDLFTHWRHGFIVPRLG